MTNDAPNGALNRMLVEVSLVIRTAYLTGVELVVIQLEPTMVLLLMRQPDPDKVGLFWNKHPYLDLVPSGDGDYSIAFAYDTWLKEDDHGPTDIPP